MNTVRLGIVGLGRMGTSYCEIVNDMRGVTLAGVVDIDPERGAAIAAEYGVSAHASTEDLLNEGLDGLIVATSDDAHLAPTLVALAADVDVFVEKPLATTLEDARTILKASRASSAKVLVGHVCRLDPSYVAVRSSVTTGALGEVKYVYARRSSTPGTLQRMNGRVSCAAYLGIHDVDLMQWLVGASVQRVTSRSVGPCLEGIEADALVVSILEFDNGAIGVLENSWLRPDGPTVDKTAWMHIHGDAGMAEISPFVAASKITGSRVSTHNQVYLDSATATKSGGLYAEEVEHFLAVIARQAEPIATVEDGLRAVAAISAIEESLASKSPAVIGDAVKDL